MPRACSWASPLPVKVMEAPGGYPRVEFPAAIPILVDAAIAEDAGSFTHVDENPRSLPQSLRDGAILGHVEFDEGVRVDNLIYGDQPTFGSSLDDGDTPHLQVEYPDLCSKRRNSGGEP
jgi:hypothetical protein